MIRIGLGILAASAVTLGFVALQGCSDENEAPPPPPGGTGGGTGAGGGSAMGGSNPGGNGNGGAGATPGGTPCTGTCCPTEKSCYSDPNTGNGSPGSECLATQDNTGKDHIQMRQQWIRAVTPAGNASGLVYAVLAGRTQLPWKACNQTGGIGSGGYIQLVDFFLGGSDINTHYSTVGYAKYVPGPTTPGDPAFAPTPTLTDGFCYGTEDYAGDATYRLAANQVGDGAGFPTGVPKPMALAAGPWKVLPSKAKRLADDFDIGGESNRTAAQEAKRVEILGKLDKTTGEYGMAGFDGIFYYDSTTGTSHGFGALGWVVVYDATGATHIAIPIREVELRSTFNDPTKPNCVGKYLPDNLDQTTCVAGQDPTKPGWGGGNCTATTGTAACGSGESAASTKGYFIISELEQIYAPDLQSTLCVSYPGTDPATSQPRVQAEGFYDATRKGCLTSKWNPADPTGGLPMGDWCAKTNGPATADCHDAWRSISFHAFAGAKIKMDADKPSTCAF